MGILGIILVDSWGPTILADVHAAFSAKPELLLELLKCLGEETFDDTIVADAELFAKFSKLLIDNSEDIISLLHAFSTTHTIKVLETFLSILNVGLSDSVVLNLHNSWILNLSLQALSSPQLFNTASYIF